MVIGFDLDGTLDHPALADMCRAMLLAGHEVHIISGRFPEAGSWQDVEEKRQKLDAMNIFHFMDGEEAQEDAAMLHVLDAVEHKKFDIDYRRGDLGMRKGDLCRRLGVQVYIDDSASFCESFRAMNRGCALLQVK